MNLSRLVSPPPCLQKLEEGLRGLKGSELDAINYRVNPITAIMERYKIPLVDGSGRTIGYGDRWWTHRVRDGREGPILGEKHVGITIACLDDNGRILVQHRRHRIFDKVWSLPGDTHTRKYDCSKGER